MKTTKHLLTRLEGEVQLRLLWKKGKIADAFVIAPFYRGFEELLVGKPLMDALVITPRVCGICGHAHLRATVEAIENVIRDNGKEVKLSGKAKLIRDITLSLEKIQNHLRWFYVYLMPDFVRLDSSLGDDFAPVKGSAWKEGIKASNYATQALAVFAGQWPHSSYMVPGGITADPLEIDLLKAKSLVDNLLEFYQEKVIGMRYEEYLTLKGEELTDRVKGDMGRFISLCSSKGLDKVGSSYGRFLAGGEPIKTVLTGTKLGRRAEFQMSKVKELTDYSYFSENPKAYTWTKAVRYGGLPYETGPLARMVILRNRRIYPLFKRLKDSFMLRVIARMEELLHLILDVRNKLSRVDLKEPGWIKPPAEIKHLSGEGTGVIEAARGTLIHKVEVSKGRIKKYDIITPTVWNLGSRDSKYLGVVEKALIGLDSEVVASMVLRSFDVCSVCTTH